MYLMENFSTTRGGCSVIFLQGTDTIKDEYWLQEALIMCSNSRMT